jgi:hypothetical protein
VDNPDFQQGLGLSVHVHTTIRYDYSYISRYVHFEQMERKSWHHALILPPGFTRSAALKIGEDVLQVNSWGDYSLNGVSSAFMPKRLASFELIRTQPSAVKSVFEVDLGEIESVEICTFKDIVSVEIHHAEESGFNGSVGLTGQYGTGRMLARDGVTIIEDPIMFGQEWQGM